MLNTPWGQMMEFAQHDRNRMGEAGQGIGWMGSGKSLLCVRLRSLRSREESD